MRLIGQFRAYGGWLELEPPAGERIALVANFVPSILSVLVGSLRVPKRGRALVGWGGLLHLDDSTADDIPLRPRKSVLSHCGAGHSDVKLKRGWPDVDVVR